MNPNLANIYSVVVYQFIFIRAYSFLLLLLNVKCYLFRKYFPDITKYKNIKSNRR